MGSFVFRHDGEIFEDATAHIGGFLFYLNKWWDVGAYGNTPTKGETNMTIQNQIVGTQFIVSADSKKKCKKQPAACSG